MWFVYILLSLKDYKHYIGMTRNVSKRLKAHNNGETKSTANRRPFILLYQEKYGCAREARAREEFLKTGKGREFIKTFIPR